MPCEITIRVMQDHVAVRKQFKADDTLVGRVGLPRDSAVGVGEDEVSVGFECERGVFADGVPPVGLPDPTEKLLGSGRGHAEGELKTLKAR